MTPLQNHLEQVERDFKTVQSLAGPILADEHSWSGPAGRIRQPRREALRDDVALLEEHEVEESDGPRDLVDLLERS